MVDTLVSIQSGDRTITSVRCRTIIVLTCRQPQTDFRQPLARELSRIGHDVHYVFLRRRPTIQQLSADAPAREISLAALARQMRQRVRSNPGAVILNSTNLAFPGLCLALRLFAGGTWCFDLHDDLLYEHAGWRRRKARLSQVVLTSAADLAVHSASTLVELFPSSRHLGNASDIAFLARPKFDADDILVLASLDGRFDFDFMRRVLACNRDKRFHIHGQISKSNTQTLGRLEAMLADAPNLKYHGAYVNEDLPKLLSQYAIMLAPYVVNARLTRYIDPLRFYHCLNSGMEVITTDIPTARELAVSLTIIDAPEAFASMVDRLARDPARRKNCGRTSETYNWRAKAQTFMTIVESWDAPRHAA